MFGVNDMLRMKSSTKMSTLNKLAMAVLIVSPLVANAGNLQVKCGQFDIKIYPNAIFLNGNKVDNAHRETESDVMSYVFQNMQRWAEPTRCTRWMFLHAVK